MMKFVRTFASLVLPLSLIGCASLDRFNPFGGFDSEADELASANHETLGAAIGNGTTGSQPVMVATVDDDEMALRLALAEAAKADKSAGATLEQISTGGVKVSVPSEVCFPYDSSKLLGGFKPTLNQVADVLMKIENTRVDVIGYTDAKGGSTYNKRLSQRRAKAVSDYLISRGVPKDRIYIDGRGAANPRGSNDTEAGRQLNRRVELVVQTTDY